MSKPVKAMVTAELQARFAGTDSACVVDMTGMNVQQQERLRTLLREKSARLQVVKNSLARQAFEGGPLEPLGRTLEGPCALVTGRDSLILVARALVEAAKEFEQLKLKQAILDGAPETLTVEELSKLKGLREMVGDIAALVGSPGRALAGCLRSPQACVAGCLKSLADRAA